MSASPGFWAAGQDEVLRNANDRRAISRQPDVHDTETWNAVATVLTLMANLATVLLAAVGMAAVVGGQRGRRLGQGVAVRLAPFALGGALAVAVVATAGSLGYSEIVGFVPCLLCWDQRICMYPLVAILAIALVRRDGAFGWYAAPFVITGIGIALNHWLIERGSTLPARPGATCGVPYFEKLGFVTLAYMDLSAFLLIAALLLLDGASSDPPANL